MPVRTCVGCREVGEQSALIRFARDGGAIVADPGRRLPGRGAYLHRTLACAEAARKRRALERALGGSPDGAWVESVVRT